MPIQIDPTTFTTAISLVKSYSTIQGFDANFTDKVTLDAYYGGAYFQRNAFQDVTSPLVTKPFIGFGGTNSPNSATRAYQEGTGGLTYTVWKDPKYGAMQWVAQGSYIRRSPWFVPAGAPTNAHAFMMFMSLRYILPGKAPESK